MLTTLDVEDFFISNNKKKKNSHNAKIIHI